MGLPVERIAEEPHLGRAKIFYDQYPSEVLAREKKYGQKHLFQYDGGLMYPIRRLQNHMDGSIIELANTMKRQAESYSYVNYAANNNGFTSMMCFPTVKSTTWKTERTTPMGRITT